MSDSSSNKSGFNTTKIIGLVVVLAVGWVVQKYFPQFGNQGDKSKNRSQQEAGANGGSASRAERANTGATKKRTESDPSASTRSTRSNGSTSTKRKQGSSSSTKLNNAGVSRIEQAFARKESGFMVTVHARVRKVLPDDNEGSRHQRLIIELSNRKTLLVAHNIDLAPRVPCRKGDVISIRGQYEYSDKGGVLHWTHHDPRKRHPEGWIEFEGKTFE